MDQIGLQSFDVLRVVDEDIAAPRWSRGSEELAAPVAAVVVVAGVVAQRSRSLGHPRKRCLALLPTDRLAGGQGSTALSALPDFSTNDNVKKLVYTFDIIDARVTLTSWTSSCCIHETAILMVVLQIPSCDYRNNKMSEI